MAVARRKMKRETLQTTDSRPSTVDRRPSITVIDCRLLKKSTTVTSARSRSDIAFDIVCVIIFQMTLETNIYHTKYLKGNVASRPGRGHRSGFFQKTTVDHGGRRTTVGGRRSAVGGRWSAKSLSSFPSFFISLFSHSLSLFETQRNLLAVVQELVITDGG